MHSKHEIAEDPACYTGTTTLVNKLGLQDSRTLTEAEAVLSYLRAESFEMRLQAFDLPALQAIHHHLFQDLYPWAGELRSTDISKGNTLFCAANCIEAEANKLFGKLVEEKVLVDLPLPAFVQRLAYYYCELNVIHPFRDGNGRAQRLFFELLAINAGFGLDWAKVERSEWVAANIAGYAGDLQPLQALFERIAVSV
jgi:cell filamentation protein